MKNGVYVLSLSLLLVGCGTQPSVSGAPTPAPVTSISGKTPPNFTGFEVQGQPEAIKRHVVLPSLQPMPMTLRPQALTPLASSLPAWTGPRLFSGTDTRTPYNYDLDWVFDVSSKGELFAQNMIRSSPSQAVPLPSLQLFKYSPTGQLLASKTADPKMITIENLANPYAPGLWAANRHWLVVTEDSSTEETYQIVNSYGGQYYGGTNGGETQLLSEVYGSSLIPLQAHNDPVYPVFLGHPVPLDPVDNNLDLKMKAGKQGIVMSGPRYAPNSGNGVESINRVDVYEASHQPWEEVGVMQRNSLLSPKELPEAHPFTQFAVSNDGSVYVAIFIAWDGCYEFCASYASLTKFVNGRVVWQNYWETGNPVKIWDVAANDNQVSLLIGSKQDSTAPEDSTILSFSSSGNSISNVKVPLDDLRATITDPDQDRRRVVPSLDHLSINGSGLLIASSSNVILSGTLLEGFTHSYINTKAFDPYRPSDGDLRLRDVIFKSNYVYALADRPNRIDRALLAFDTNLNLR